jgi:hypothetical protein
MIGSTLDWDPIMRTIERRLTSAGKVGAPGWFAGARLTFAEPDLSAAGLQHAAGAEIIAVAQADSQQRAVGAVAEFVHSSGRSARLVKAGIAALRQIAMPLGGSVHPAPGHPIVLKDPLTTRAGYEEELLRHTVCNAVAGELQYAAVRRREEAWQVAEVSAETMHDDTLILIRGVAGPAPCAWCTHRALERVVGSTTTIPSGWPRSERTDPSYDEFVTLGRFDQRHTFMTAYLRAMTLASATELVQLLLGY